VNGKSNHWNRVGKSAFVSGGMKNMFIFEPSCISDCWAIAIWWLPGGSDKALRKGLFLICLVVYVLLRSAFWRKWSPKSFSDTEAFVNVANASLTSKKFWAAGRPWTVPLLYKILRIDFKAISALQFSLSLISWGTLAIVTGENVHIPWLQPVAFVLVLAFSLGTEVVLWDKVYLGESVTLSMLALFIASWLWFLNTRDWAACAAVILTGILWIFARDTNAYGAAVAVPFLAAAGILRKFDIQYLTLAAVFLILIILSYQSAQLGRRWVTPLFNVIGHRLLKDDRMISWFEQRGMPVSPALMERAGHYSWDDDYLFHKAPDLAGFRRWLFIRGKSLYTRYLMTNPAMVFQAPLDHPETLTAPEMRAYSPGRFTPILPFILSQIFFPEQYGRILVLLCAITAGTGLGAFLYCPHDVLVFPILLMSSAYIQAVIVWYGDAAEVARHALVGCVQLRVGWWLLIFLLIETVVQAS
jgi:hypothetical protein